MVEKRGMKWLDESVKYVIEDKKNNYVAFLQMMPIARTPMDAKSGRAMQKYYKDVAKAFERMTPWASHTKRRVARARLKKGQAIESGTVVVIDSGGIESSNLIKGAKVIG